MSELESNTDRELLLGSPSIGDEGLRCLAVAYAYLRTESKPIPAHHLRFHARLTDNDLRIMSQVLGLLFLERNGYVVEPLGLAYLAERDPHARADLARIRLLWQLAHDHYQPDGPPLSPPVLVEAGIPGEVFERLRLQTQGRFSLALTQDGGLQPTERDWESQTFLEAWHTAYRDPSRRPDRPATPPVGEPPFRLAVTRLHAVRFRCLHDLDLALGPLTVVVGPNAAGKSTLLGVLQWMSSLMREGIGAGARSVDRVRTRAQSGPVCVTLELGLRYGTSGESVPARYELHADSLEGTDWVAHESLEVRARRLIENERGRVLLTQGATTTEAFISPSALALRGTPEIERPAPSDHLAVALGSAMLLQRELVGPEADPRWQWSPPVEGQPSWRTMLVEIALEPQLNRKLIDVLALLAPEIGGVRIEARGGTCMLVEQAGSWFDVGELSGGTRQMLVLAALYVHPSPPHIVLIEEPEGAVHPLAQGAMVDLLRSIARRSTVIVTSHSPTFVARFDREREVVALWKDDRGTHASSLAEAIRSSSWLSGFGSTVEAFEHLGGGPAR